MEKYHFDIHNSDCPWNLKTKLLESTRFAMVVDAWGLTLDRRHSFPYFILTYWRKLGSSCLLMLPVKWKLRRSATDNKLSLGINESVIKVRNGPASSDADLQWKKRRGIENLAQLATETEHRRQRIAFITYLPRVISPFLLVDLACWHPAQWFRSSRPTKLAREMPHQDYGLMREFLSQWKNLHRPLAKCKKRNSVFLHFAKSF